MSIFKNNFVVGITAGLVASILAPVIIPAAKRSARPLAKALIKGGLIAYEKGREVVATTGEMIEDVVAEIRAEEGRYEPAGDGEARDERPEAEIPRGAVAVGNGQSRGMRQDTLHEGMAPGGTA